MSTATGRWPRTSPPRCPSECLAESACGAISELPKRTIDDRLVGRRQNLLHGPDFAEVRRVRDDTSGPERTRSSRGGAFAAAARQSVVRSGSHDPRTWRPRSWRSRSGGVSSPRRAATSSATRMDRVLLSDRNARRRSSRADDSLRRQMTIARRVCFGDEGITGGVPDALSQRDATSRSGSRLLLPDAGLDASDDSSTPKR
jgi:hypothetical protein